MTGNADSAPAPDSRTVDAENPWPGLWSYREGDEEFFHGRDVETEQLRRLVLRSALTVVFGRSGLGKTSLLCAGLFPRIREARVFPVYVRLAFPESGGDLAAQVTGAIARQAAEQGIDAPLARPGETLWEYFHRQGAAFWSARNKPLTPLLVFDQFEEIFTLGQLDERRASATEVFVEQLADLVEGRPPKDVRARLDAAPDEARKFAFTRHAYKALISLREDYLAPLEGLRNRMPSLAHNRLRLRRMNGRAALEVVLQARDRVSPEVGEQIVRFVAAAQGTDTDLATLEVEPPLLSVVCRELNNQRKGGSITERQLVGAQADILSKLYERSVDDLDPGVRRFIEDELLTVSGYRDNVALENALQIPGVTTEAIDLLVRRRLVRRGERDGVERVELTHDVLTGVIAKSRDRRKRAEAAAEQDATLRAEEEHRNAERLAEEERREEERRAAAEREKQVQTARENRRQKNSIVMLVLMLVAALGATIWAFSERDRAADATRVANENMKRALEGEQEARTNLEQAQESIALAEQEEAARLDLLAAAREGSEQARERIADLEARLEVARSELERALGKPRYEEATASRDETEKLYAEAVELLQQGRSAVEGQRQPWLRSAHELVARLQAAREGLGPSGAVLDKPITALVAGIAETESTAEAADDEQVDVVLVRAPNRILVARLLAEFTGWEFDQAYSMTGADLPSVVATLPRPTAEQLQSRLEGTKGAGVVELRDRRRLVDLPGALEVLLGAAGEQKIAVIKAVRAFTGLGLKDSKALVDSAPEVLPLSGKTSRTEIWKHLEQAGANVSVVQAKHPWGSFRVGSSATYKQSENGATSTHTLERLTRDVASVRVKTQGGRDRTLSLPLDIAKAPGAASRNLIDWPGAETITVPAGTFKCWVCEYVQQSGRTYESVRVWMRDNVPGGWVKRITTARDRRGNTTTLELVRFLKK